MSKAMISLVETEDLQMFIDKGKKVGYSPSLVKFVKLKT